VYRSMRLMLLAATLLVLAGLLPGAFACAPAEPTTPPPAEQPEAPDVSPMDVDDRRSAFPADFPLEIPVAAGRVTAAEVATGTATGLYSYELEVDAPADTVIAWYRTVYSGARWQQVAEERSGSALSGLSFAKGGLGSIVRVEAQSGVTVVRVDFGDRTLVEQPTF